MIDEWIKKNVECVYVYRIHVYIICIHVYMWCVYMYTVYIYNKISFCLYKWYSAICENMNEPGGNKLDIKRRTLYDLIYIWNLKKSNA